ncbi:ATP-binding protein [Magnetovibrio sp. PR-2]|uniref:ATP-binding protein n=1 Tax=Magnetovibrio sp. PR-2 TaxID=3120356 RepID=UPI002FCE33C4
MAETKNKEMELLRQFAHEVGNVEVKGTVNRKNEALLLVVQDSGKGMRTTITNAIKKGEGVTTSYEHSNRKGWGIGMQTVMEKANQLGGELIIERAMNGGTVVCVKFPMDESIAA